MGSHEESISLGPWGGEGGESWNHEVEGKIKHIIITHGDVIDSISFKDDGEGSTWSQKFGGDGGHSTKIVLDYPDEYLVEISGHYGTFLWGRWETLVRSLTFQTNLCKYGPYGSQSGTHFSFPMKNGVITGFHGRAGKFLNSIGVYAKSRNSFLRSHLPSVKVRDCPATGENSDDNKVIDFAINEEGPREVGPWGGEGGCSWDDGVFSGIKQIFVWRDESVLHSIQIEYDHNGQSVLSPTHGGSEGELTHRIQLNFPEEYLMYITGFYGPVHDSPFLAITSLTFYTNKGKYGPLGDEIGIFFHFKNRKRQGRRTSWKEWQVSGRHWSPYGLQLNLSFLSFLAL
ncbi:agglutinin-like [Tasmannia lanceolata]|uniref:agglutinin-like n=1 Tax=Tasmannia lanceolata TaxID=3420 RepID=UPI0040634BD0